MFLLLLIYACIWRLALPLITQLSSLPMGFPPDLNGMLLAFVETPMIWAYFILSASAIPDIFNVVLTKGLLSKEIETASYKNFLDRIETSFNHRRWFIIAMGLALLGSACQVGIFWPNNPYLWYEPQKHAWYGALEISTYSLSQYMVLAAAIRQSLTVFWLNRLFHEFDIVVLLNHPDKSGGWFAVGRQAAALSLLVVAITIWAVGLTISPQLPTIYSLPLQTSAWMLFTLLAPIAFLLPMLSTHRAMQKYKQSVLGEISQLINVLLNAARTSTTTALVMLRPVVSAEVSRLPPRDASLISGDAENRLPNPLSGTSQDSCGHNISELIEKSKMKALFEEIETLRSWHKMVDELPDWPFSMDLLRRVGVTWVLPLATGVISTVTQYAVSKFLP
ncbi:MAG: hypothetical protein NT169_25790 [Chloroflexi bacterium]|nr:hypothetical protein [Chloroflexota bacterium]